MKKLSLILLVYLGLIGTAFADHSTVGLDKLKATNDCEFCHLKGTNLSGQDFSGAKINISNFVGADLSGANLSGADLTGANFKAAVLDGADFSEAILCNTKMSNGDIDNSGC